ncbi:hypothetical protein FA10DRAFT_264209 [Acaromyces ingoldii]|uniref:Uncharacterized protein n=1 Tax=Acaromyces ingoldii TaxID=215250 RepID=A0A316YXU4_9BASI|nr:hypothetical protein FA10DRAFT_264209 [Acaromyces ingoldii]PWN93574.1 hypothetical protein FA10DRAFT_264209 [Acaromyces ingoldii]
MNWIAAFDPGSVAYEGQASTSAPTAGTVEPSPPRISAQAPEKQNAGPSRPRDAPGRVPPPKEQSKAFNRPPTVSSAPSRSEDTQPNEQSTSKTSNAPPLIASTKVKKPKTSSKTVPCEAKPSVTTNGEVKLSKSQRKKARRKQRMAEEELERDSRMDAFFAAQQQRSEGAPSAIRDLSKSAILTEQAHNVDDKSQVGKH